MVFSESGLNVRRGLVVGASLLLGGLGCEATGSDTSDAQAAPTADPTLSGCAAISDDLSPTAQAGPLDGIYGHVDAGSIRATPTCTVADDGRTVHSTYVKLDRERFTTYLRVYPVAQGCGTAFDLGGQIRVISEGVMRGCDSTYNTSDGTYRQAVYLARLSTGSLFRSSVFYGEGPTHPAWRELIVSTLSSNNPFERAPADLSFGHFRRPK
jgi:hypothetical protein